MTELPYPLLGTLYGLVGLQARLCGPADAWIVRNATLPDDWDSLSFGRVMVGGTAYGVDAVHGMRPTFTQL